MARGLFRIATDPAPGEPNPGADLICDGGWGSSKCGLPKYWIVKSCDRGGCPGFWAWGCRLFREAHAGPDDLLDLALHGASHNLRAKEALVETHCSCPCGARDWEAGKWWVPDNLHALRFTCRGCGNATCVSEFVLHAWELGGQEMTRPRWGEPPRPCACGRSTVHSDNGDWIGPECACCGGIAPDSVANQARPLCDGCQPNPKADEMVRLIAAGTVDRRLKWLDKGRVRVVIARVVPRLGPAGQRLGGRTLLDRRVRMARGINARLRRAGWTFLPSRFDQPNDYAPGAGIRSEPRSPAQSPGTASWAW